ncbi:helicase-related protein [Geodermatophilus obscurus]|uniref:helicase-related protein n=1 Tax=Geodermatophilus obscurus TaxID=1861 RepID=UPI003132EBB3
MAAETVTGDQPSDVRATALARLARAGQPGQPQVRVVTNGRCLTAGVDVPALDAVVFVDPRRSRADVVQALGRVLRRAESKDLGRRRRADPHRCSPESGPVQPLHRRGRRGRHLTRVLIDRGAHPC